LSIEGKINFLLMAGVIGMILLSASWKPGVEVHVAGGTLALQNVLRDVALLGLAGLSLLLTSHEHRLGNGFHWGPIQEVAQLFLGIFLTMIPVLAMLKAGSSGAFAPLVALVTSPEGTPNPFAYFWMTGLLSSFLDNAPTYLVFFELAGGDARTLMGPLGTTLMAISTGAVYMGAMSYIGNAPNFMVYAIAKDRGIRMPSFFGYLVWSSCLLLPVLVLASWVFFLV
jgi:Na+/H+ antiporter NhaD/arsenite permease-like protein